MTINITIDVFIRTTFIYFCFNQMEDYLRAARLNRVQALDHWALPPKVYELLQEPDLHPHGCRHKALFEQDYCYSGDLVDHVSDLASLIWSHIFMLFRVKEAELVNLGANPGGSSHYTAWKPIGPDGWQHAMKKPLWTFSKIMWLCTIWSNCFW